MAKPKFGTVGDEAQVLELIRRMNDDGDKPTQILGALTAAGYRSRTGKPFLRQGIQSLVVDLDRARRVVLDLRQRSSLLAESLVEIKALSKTDATCAVITERVQSLQAGGRPQVAAIAEAVKV